MEKHEKKRYMRCDVKLMGMLIVIVSCTLIGCKYSLKYSLRLNDLRIIKRMINMLKGEIKYKSSLLEEAFGSMKDKFNKPYSDFLHSISSELSSGDMIYEEIVLSGLEIIRKNTALSNKDIERISQVLNNLGYLDKEMQLISMNMYLEELEESEKEASLDVSKNGKLFKILGVFTGLFICIFMM